MGIDVYLQWDGQTEAEVESQIATGFSVVDGHVGYLREAYHGGPYATRVLAPESFEAGSGPVEIPVTVLRERLPAVIEAAMTRARSVYGAKDLTEENVEIQSFRQFVELAEAKANDAGNVRIYASY